MSRISRRHTERGQMLVIVAFGMIVLVAMVGLIVDGGNAWGRQRDTQNAADSMAKAGAAVIQSSLGDSSVRDGDVGCAVEAAATQNGVEVEDVVYTTFDGSDLSPAVAVGPCSPGGGPAIPADAQGIRARDAQTFETYLIRVIGFRDVTAYADATAVVGVRTAVCPASAGCGILPVTFPRTLDTCDGTNRQVIGEDEWELIDPAETPLDASNLAIVPLCKKGPGSVGWLDFEGCPNNLQHVIDTPCNVFIPIPSWEHTSTGNTNALEDNLAVYHGDDPGVAEDEDIVVYIPIFDFECRDELADDDPVEDCPSYPAFSGNGSNLYYHIPYWAGFKMDGAFTGGNDRECDQLPGAPFAGGNGATGCLKGWFVELVPAPGPIGVGEINPGDSVSTGILLIE